MVRRHTHVKMGYYHQHLSEKLDMDLSPLAYMMKEYPKIKEVDQMRKIIGRYGITGKQQTMPIRNLSEGQKCRVSLAWLAWQNPHMLLFDEPTNHLDLESIDALADAIKKFNGGMVLVSHDFRLISQVAKEIWICEKQSVTKWNGSIVDYKEMLKANVLGEDGKKKDMAAASADHYHKEDPVLAKNHPRNTLGQKQSPAPIKKMQILSISKNNNLTNGSAGSSRNNSASPQRNGNSNSPKPTGGKFVPPGARNQAKTQNGHMNGNGEDYFGF
jgi:energy-coupling factor transporter ATP-binding protein EcfA2